MNKRDNSIEKIYVQGCSQENKRANKYKKVLSHIFSEENTN